MKTPCKDCERRYLGCHSECPEYIEFSRERNEMLEKRNRDINTLYDNEIVHKRTQRWRRSVRK